MKTSWEFATEIADLGLVEIRTTQAGEVTTEFLEYREDADGAPFFRGLPGDRCQAHHTGYVVRGETTMHYADRDETFREGEAFAIEPGHVPSGRAGTLLVTFTSTDEYQRTAAVLAANAASLLS